MDLEDDDLPFNWNHHSINRVPTDENFEYDLLQEGRETFTQRYWILSTMGIILLISLIYLIFSLIALTTQPHLPPINRNVTSHKFSELNARNYLFNITSIRDNNNNTLSRVCGTEGNEKAFQYITEWIYQIKEEAKKNDYINFTVEIQDKKGIGPINWNFDPIPHFYHVKNIHVMLSPKNIDKSNLKAALYTANIDSRQYPAMGAHDGGISLSVGLEMIRVLSQSKVIKNPIIFSFLNCEEVGFLGSAAVLTEEWFNQVNFLLNYFNTGKIEGYVLMHSYIGNSWVISEYKKAASKQHFYKANSLFMDFSDFNKDEKANPPTNRDGEINALDFSNRGNVQFDDTDRDYYDNIPKGVIQMSGDLFVSLMEGVSTSNNINKLSDQTTNDLYFYDIAGHTMVVLKRVVLIGLSITTFFISMGLSILYLIFYSRNEKGIVGDILLYLKSFAIIIVTFFLIIAFVIAGTLLVAPNPLFYFRSSGFANAYWFLLGLCAVFLIQYIIDRKKVKKIINIEDDKESGLLVGVNLFWTLFMLFNWWLPAYKTFWSFQFFFALMSNIGLLLRTLGTKYLKRYLHWSFVPRDWTIGLTFIWFTLTVSVPSIIWISSHHDLQTLLLLDVGLKNSVKVGINMGIFVSSLLINISPLIHLAKYKGRTLIVLASMFIIFYILLAVQPKYDMNHPKRIIFDEVEIHDDDGNYEYYIQLRSGDKLPIKPYIRNVLPETAECDSSKCIYRKVVQPREYLDIDAGIIVNETTTIVNCIYHPNDSLFQTIKLYFNDSEISLDYIVVDNELVKWNMTKESFRGYTASTIPIRYKRGMKDDTIITFVFKGMAKSDFLLHSIFDYEGPTEEFLNYLETISDLPLVFVMNPTHYRIEHFQTIEMYDIDL